MTSHHHFRLLPLILLAIIGSRACGTITSGTCTSHIDCTATIRSRSPDPSELCECYAASSTDPFDECEGNESDCAIARCVNTCDGLESLCLTLTDDGNDGASVCEITAPAVAETSGTITPGTCTADTECTAKIRSRSPDGTKLCECYAASSTAPFDECEGEDDSTCVIAGCINNCDGMEAHCLVDGTMMCALRNKTASGSLDLSTRDAEPNDLLSESSGMLPVVSLSILTILFCFGTSI